MHGSGRGGSFIKDFLVGGISGTVAKTTSAPLERVKLLLQVQDTSKGGAPQYQGIIDCLSKVSSEQGIASLWRGNVSNCVRYFPTQAINFASKARLQKLFVRHNKKENFWKFFLEMLASGGAAGATSLAVVYPLDFARTRLAAEHGNTRQYTGLVDCCRSVYKKEGMQGLYRGFASSVAGIVVYRAAFFGVYDTFRAVTEDMFKSKGASKLKPVVNFAVGFAAETAAGVIAYPFDTVRRRLMMQAGGVQRYSGTIDCTRKILREEGATAFYKGCFSNILRGISGAMVVVLYDEFAKKDAPQK